MPAINWPIKLEEKADFDLNVAWQDDDCNPVNITGYGAKLQVRNKPGAATALLTASVSNGLVSLAVKSGVTSEFQINIPAASVTAIKDDITDDAGYTFIVWPTAADPDTDPKRLLHGSVEYSESYTQ